MACLSHLLFVFAAALRLEEEVSYSATYWTSTVLEMVRICGG